MKKIMRTYIIIWAMLLIISLILIFALPSIWIYYTGFINIKPQDIGIPNEAVAIITKGINIADNLLPKHLRVADIAKMALSYMTAYVPADFPENNLPVKFWGSVIFVVFLYIENLIITIKTLKKIQNTEDAFYNIPIIGQSVFCLIVGVAVALLVVINDKIYYVMAIVAYLILIMISLLILLGISTIKDYIYGVDVENKTKTQLIKDIKQQSEIVYSLIYDEESKEKLKKFIDEVNYSSKASKENTIGIENNILDEINLLKSKIKENSQTSYAKEIDRLFTMLNQRNILAKS